MNRRENVLEIYICHFLRKKRKSKLSRWQLTAMLKEHLNGKGDFPPHLKGKQSRLFFNFLV